MALRINTNIAAMSAHKNLIKNDNSLSESLGRLSSGLRINKAADDASGMAIADSLRSQALGLGQAIKNGNDGIAIVQTADAALEESINIVNTIKQKSIQSAQDGQTTDSRKAIQADITKLREELDTIAKTTSFNGQKLLSGNFSDKKFQIGAYAGETIDINIQSTEATKIGHITTSDLTFAGEGTTELNIFSNLKDETYNMKSVELAYNNSRENSVGAIADNINKLSDVLGISATAVVESTSGKIAAGTTDTFVINGTNIGEVSVANGDDTGSLVAEINKKTSEHGVTATEEGGFVKLTSTDDRAIKVEMGAATKAVFGGVDDMSTFGKVEVRQEGTSSIQITDANAQAGIAVSTADGLMKVNAIGSTASEMVLASGTLLAASTTLGSGAVLNGSFKTSAAVAISAGDDGNVIGAGSIISSGSTIGSGTTLQGDFRIEDMGASANNTIVASGSLLKAHDDTNINSGSVFEGDVSAFISGSVAGAVNVSGGKTYVKGGYADIKVDFTTTGTTLLTSGAILEEGTILTAGTTLGGDITTDGGRATTLSADMKIEGAAGITTSSTFKTGTVIAADELVGSGSISGGSVAIASGSQIGVGSSLANGSSLGLATVTQEDEVVSEGKDMLLKTGSTIASGSTISAGTVLTNDITAKDGTKFKEGMTLENDIITGIGVETTKDMVINGGSILKAGTTLGKNDVSADNTVDSKISDNKSYRLSDVDVTTQEGAQIGIAVADAALKNLDKVRSDLGSVQNQLTSTISNISTTRVNVSAAESSIRDVDFAEESSNFTKMQILSQAGTFAMSQANASSQNVLSLLQ
jgi:flagellin